MSMNFQKFIRRVRLFYISSVVCLAVTLCILLATQIFQWRATRHIQSSPKKKTELKTFSGPPRGACTPGDVAVDTKTGDLFSCVEYRTWRISSKDNQK